MTNKINNYKKNNPLKSVFRIIYLLFTFKNLSVFEIRKYAFLLKDRKYLEKISKKYNLNPNVLDILCKLLRFRIIYIISDFILSVLKFISKKLYFNNLLMFLLKKK